MTRADSETGELAGTAPQMLAAALNMAGATVRPEHLAKAHTILRDAGEKIAITKNGARERDPAFAPHGVNVSDLSSNFSYSAEGSPGHETCCDGFGRWLYLGEREAAPIPWIHGIITAQNGRTQSTAVLMSATADTKRVPVAWEDIEKSTWATLIETPLSADSKIMTAATTTIKELAWDASVKRIPAAVTPTMRTETGHVPEPVTECMPDGYWAQPDRPEAERLKARAMQAEIAARHPKIALAWGASAGSFYIGPLRLRQSGFWEFVGAPRRGKTTTLMLCASVWGYPAYPPDGMLGSWDQTSKGFGRHLGELGIFPAFMDETGTSDNGPPEWFRLVYGTSSGASRQTAQSKSMGTNRTPGWHGIAFTTGNGSITEGAAGRFAGVPARVVTLSGEFTAGPEECAQLDAAALDDYGYIGPAVRAALTVDEFGQMYRDALEALDAPAGGIAGTLAEKVALAIAGARAIDLVLGTGTRIGDAAHRGALDYLAQLDATETDRERILRRIGELLSAEKMAWPDAAKYSSDQYRSYSGVVDDTWVYVYPSTWKDITEGTGVGNSAKLALADMHARGELHVPESRRKRGEWHGQSPQWAGPVRVYKIALAAIRDTDAGADAGTNAGDAGTRIEGDAGIAPTLTSNDAENAGDAGNPAPRLGDSPLNAGDAGTRIEGDAGIAPTLTSNDAENAGDAGNPAPRLGENAPEGWPADSIGATANPAPAAAEHQAHAHQTTPRHADFGSDFTPAPTPEENLETRSTTTTPSKPREGHPMTTTTTPEQHRNAWLAATWTKPGNSAVFKTPEQRNALTRVVTLLDSNPDPADKDAVRKLKSHLRVLDELQGTAPKFGGPFIPTHKGKPALLKPWGGETGLPPCIETARIQEGYAHQRDDYHGPVTVFDRNGAWIGSTGTALVAHGALTRTGECDPKPSGTTPGYYLMTVYPWTEPGMPSPFGNAETGTQVWVPAPTAGLAAELANAGRWPDATASDSWTGTPITLNEWGRFIREMRRYALETYGYGSGAYTAAKDSIGQALAMMTGELADDTTRPVRVWKKCWMQRIDWRHQIITHSAVGMWRTMDRCLIMAGGNPDLAPIGMRNKDELLIPDNGAAELVTTTNYRGGTRPPVRIDNTGVTLGTFKVKSRETRA